MCLEKARCCGGQTITIRRNTAEGFDVIWDGNVEDQNGGVPLRSFFGRATLSFGGRPVVGANSLAYDSSKP